MRVLLDTHTLLWWAAGDRRLSPRAARLLSAFSTEGLVSAASAWEICTKVRLGKLPGLDAFAQDLPARIQAMGFHELPVSLAHAQRAGLLPVSHKDPFDRMLIAQSLAENIPLVSSEQIFDSYGTRRVW
jgi:PIN domain nuclease of toxin-antitoxin system